MRRHLTAAVLTLVSAAGAAAQPPAPANPQAPPIPALNPNLGSLVLQVGPPPPLPSLNVVVPGPTPTPGPPLAPGGPGYYKSGGVVVGANGAYPYDSGAYLLAGTDGLARSTGTFTMVPVPGGEGSGAGDGSCGYVAGRCRSYSCLKHFKR